MGPQLPNRVLSALDGARYDVVVCGAGSAGIAAAVAAARCGARTALVERYGYAGGTNTASMVHSLDAVRNCRSTGRLVVAGVALELMNELQVLGGMVANDNPPETTVFHPELLKVAADRLLHRAGVEVFYYATLIGVFMEDRVVRGAEVALRDGRAAFPARVLVDCTGDADAAFLAGAPCRIDPGLQAMTCWFRLGNLRGEASWSELEDQSRAALAQAHRRGEVPLFGGPWIIRLNAHEATFNLTRVYGSPVDPRAITGAEMEAREQMLKMAAILRASVPALGDSYLVAASSQLHIRESRKIVGEYTLEEKEVLSGARFEDAIGLGAWPIDIHPTDGFVGVHPHKENPPAPYEVPYRCLVPLEVENLLVAGKPISSTHRAHGSTRIQGTSFATGHAAGAAAALACSQGVTPRRLDVTLLRRVLCQQGAILSVDAQREAEIWQPAG